MSSNATGYCSTLTGSGCRMCPPSYLYTWATPSWTAPNLRRCGHWHLGSCNSLQDPRRQSGKKRLPGVGVGRCDPGKFGSHFSNALISHPPLVTLPWANVTPKSLRFSFQVNTLKPIRGPFVVQRNGFDRQKKVQKGGENIEPYCGALFHFLKMRDMSV